MAFGICSPSAQTASPASESPIEHSQPVANATAQSHPGSKTEASAGKPYYIEFRSRSAQSYGHTFSIYGRLNGQGKIASKAVAGLHPFTESALPWMVGHLFLVPSETGASDGDTEDQYVTARFRVALSQAEYAKVTSFVKDLQKKSPVWHAVLYNCNAFVGDVAKFMGLKAPFNTMQMPKDFINDLKAMNGGRPVLSGEAPREAAAPVTNSERAQAAPSSPRAASGNARAQNARPQTARPQQAAVRAPEQAAPCDAAVQ
jgi:hypothetical protein